MITAKELTENGFSIGENYNGMDDWFEVQRGGVEYIFDSLEGDIYDVDKKKYYNNINEIEHGTTDYKRQ